MDKTEIDIFMLLTIHVFKEHFNIQEKDKVLDLLFTCKCHFLVENMIFIPIS